MPDLENGPAVVAVTSLSPDHLDWHGTVERYYADKLSLCTKPGVTLALADGSDEELRAHAALLGPHLRWVSGAEVERDTRWSASLGLTGCRAEPRATPRWHTPCSKASAFPGASDENRLAEAAQGFEGLPSRCRSLGSVGAVEFINDGLSTNVLPAQAALEAFAERPVALLVGGHDRGLDYTPLGRTIAAPHHADARRHHARQRATHRASRARHPGRAGRSTRCRQPGGRGRDHAFDWAPDGGVVLLSPAAPSFGALR